MVRSLTVSMMAVTLLAGIGCLPQQADHPVGVVESRGTGQPTPVKIAVLADQTGSIRWTRTPALQLPDLEPLIELLPERGGELALGLIRDRSNRGLLRLRLDRKPPPPDSANRLRVMAQKPAYERVLSEWQSRSARELEQFRTAAAELLQPSGLASCTDIWGALTRADLFLAEQEPQWVAVERYLVLISDGEHNCGGRPAPFRSDAKLLLVNGSASVGALAKLRPLCFESPSAAFRLIITSRREGSAGAKRS